MVKDLASEDFGSSPPPPRRLYKYLSAERVENVLAGSTVRFTPLLNTNDSFEVRSTFHRFAGPRFLSMLAEQMDEMSGEEYVNARLMEVLQEAGRSDVTLEDAKQFLERQYGPQFLKELRAQMQLATDALLVPFLNSPERADELLNKWGRRLLCFSLSERFDSTPMWAHYAATSTGFVVALDTNNDWFHNRKDGKKTRLQKVKYFDGKIEEPLEDVQAAFISKTNDWAYEREWRLYFTKEQVDKTIGHPDDPIHLVSFPTEAVKQVIVGVKATSDTISRIREVMEARYPDAALYQAAPDRATHTYQLVPI